MNNNLELVINNNNIPVTSSKVIAEVFEKRHKDLLMKIREKKELFDEPKITLATYVDKHNQERPLYYLDRDATAFFIMGFTGTKADEWKLKYIDAFNKMEERLKKQPLLLTERERAILDIFNAKNDSTRTKAINDFERAVTKPLLETIEESKPKVTYYDDVLQCETLASVKQIAIDYGMSAKKMNLILAKLKIQYKLNGQWLLYSKYQDKGYTQSVTDVFGDKKQYCIMRTKWTQKGRKFIYEELKSIGIMPLKEEK